MWNGKPRASLHQSGDPEWHRRVQREIVEAAETVVVPTLGPVVSRRKRTSPSGAKAEAGGIAHSPTGMAFGSEVHACFEQVGWVDEEAPTLPDTEAGRLVGELLALPVLRRYFERSGRRLSLFREQAVEAVIGGAWLSGIIDRLHVFRDETGKVAKVEVIDFKTDAVDGTGQLVERYAGQMQAYRKALGLIYPGVEIRCLLISTRLRMAVECP